jgi:hypothetical protein
LIQEELEEFGIDWGGPAVIEDESNDEINVPPVTNILQPHEMEMLKTLINPLEECDDLGISFYAMTKQFCQQIIT